MQVEKKRIVDLQSENDLRSIEIAEVGIKGLGFRAKINGEGASGKASCVAHLAKDKRGTHMSRMARAITLLIDSDLSFTLINKVITELQQSLDTKYLLIDLELLMLRYKPSPITKISGYEDYKLNLIIERRGLTTITAQVGFLATALCPASKTNSKYGAHNQRAEVKIKFPVNNFKDISRYVYLAESCLSSSVYPILKLEDEIYVTEKAFENPRFVEDAVREIAASLKLQKMDFNSISCENHESIHTHNAYALIRNE